MKRFRLQTTIRIDELLWEKFKVIAQNNIRSTNAELEYLITNLINEYEQQNGDIKVNLEDVDLKDK